MMFCRFRINIQTGVITVAPCPTPGRESCLDYEQQTVYNLTAIAADKFGDGQKVFIFVWIFLTNVNDNPPVFAPTEYYDSITEYAQQLDTPLQLLVSIAVRTCTITYTGYSKLIM